MGNSMKNFGIRVRRTAGLTPNLKQFLYRERIVGKKDYSYAVQKAINIGIEQAKATMQEAEK